MMVMILHEWAMNPTEDDLMHLADDNLGGCVLGRRTFDIAQEAWGDNPPFGESTIVVLTHRPHETIKRGDTTFVFNTEGYESALAQAQDIANGKDVSLMGANISQQYLKAGLVDEIQLHIANVILTGGRPLFADIGTEQIKLETIRVVPTPAATHIRYRVVS